MLTRKTSLPHEIKKAQRHPGLKKCGVFRNDPEIVARL